MNKQFTIKPMTIEDYDGLHALWMTIHGFGIRSIDDSREGVERFINRNPGTRCGSHRGGWSRSGWHPLSAMTDDEAVCTMYVSEKITEDLALAKAIGRSTA